MQHTHTYKYKYIYLEYTSYIHRYNLVDRISRIPRGKQPERLKCLKEGYQGVPPVHRGHGYIIFLHSLLLIL